MVNNRHIIPEISRAVSFKEMTITSPAFTDAAMLPARFTCDGLNVSPPLEIHGIPAETKSMAIIMTGTYDGKEEWPHWLAWNIPPVNHIAENRKMEMEGLNYFSRHGYEGPCPGGGLHSYCFKLYALDTLLHLPSATLKNELEKAISGHILAIGLLNCFYQHLGNATH